MRAWIRNSLYIKLMGAFLVVVLVGALVISVLTSQATRSAFNLYTTRSGQVWAQRLAPDLADYYSSNHGWQGIDEVLRSASFPMGFGFGQGPGAGQGRNGAGATQGGSSMPGMEQRLVLADAKGIVVGDTQGELAGRQLSADELEKGTAITVDNRLAGTLIITPASISAASTLASEFLAKVNRSIVSSTAIAIVLAGILGAMLFLQITAPLRQLKKAASAIASGDLDQRVKIDTHDELGELGKTFNSMAESLKNIEMQRRQLVADVAHELRTPLAAIQGTLEGMQDGVLPLDEEQLSALYSETMLLNRLVGDLKVLSLADAGQLKMEKGRIDPGMFIQQIVDRNRPQAEQKKVCLETDLQDNLPVMWMDRDRIAQVLTNLIGNALHYSRDGGSITVAAALAPASKMLEISVRDTGQGIEPADLPFIFDRFYRADKSRARSSGGSGLGLAISRQLVEAHGGKIWALSPVEPDDHPENGTKIIFTLPIPPDDDGNSVLGRS